MNSLVLICSRVAMRRLPHAEKGTLLLWSGRTAEPEVLALEELLEKKLLAIRSEHMQWAFQTGLLRCRSGRTEKNLQEWLEAGATPSMWWTSLIYERHPKLSPNLYTIYKLRCLELFIEETAPERLELYDADKRLASAIKRLCQAYGMPLRIEGLKSTPVETSRLKRFYRLLPAPGRALARFAHWWWTVRRVLPFGGRQKNQDPQSCGNLPDATIISYFPNIDMQAAARNRYRSRYWENLHELLNRQARRERTEGPHFVDWLFIRFPSEQLTLKQGLNLCKDFAKTGKDGKNYNYLEQFLSPGDLCRSLKRWAFLLLASFRIEGFFAAQCHFRSSRLDFWPYMAEEWAESMRGWRCLERCLQNAAFRRYTRECGPRRWLLFPLENCPWERMLTEAARRNLPGTPVYGAQHSIIRPTDFRYFDDPGTYAEKCCSIFQPDVFAANGQSAEKQWLAVGMPAARTRIVEALRYQYLQENRPDINAEESEIPAAPGEPVEGPGKRLLVLTSFFADETSAQLDLLRQCLEAGLLENWRVIIKPHPYLPVASWLEKLPVSYAAKIEIVATPLPTALAEGGLVWTANSTTTSLEAAIRGLPVMVMAAHNDFDLCPIQNVPGLARTSTIKDLRKYLAKWPYLNLPQAYLDLEPGLQAWQELLFGQDNRAEQAGDTSANFPV